MAPTAGIHSEAGPIRDGNAVLKWTPIFGPGEK